MADFFIPPNHEWNEIKSKKPELFIAIEPMESAKGKVEECVEGFCENKSSSREKGDNEKPENNETNYLSE